MLRRKIEKELVSWKKTPNRKPLVIKGIRQCGKTFIVKKFAYENYDNVIYLNFILESEISSLFAGNKDVESIILGISALKPNSIFIAGHTCLILDEIQDCPSARTALKSFCEDGRFDVITTGSLLGVRGYGNKKNSIPVGYETFLDMYPLDFEEFLWANGIKDTVIDAVRESYTKEEPIIEGIHTAFRTLLSRYIVVGGLPTAVNKFLETKNIWQVYEVQKHLITEYEEDMVKYGTRECFESIPKQLAKENKKFQYSIVKKNGRASQYLGSIQWLEEAGIVKRCYNISTTELPLEVFADPDCFKVYPADIGLLMGMMEYGAQADILQGNMLSGKGAIFESLMADIMIKKGKKLYYFRKDSGLEIDFLMRVDSQCTLIEVKASTGKTKSAKTILDHPEKYHVFNCIKVGDYNVGRNNQILTIPWYMAFLLGEQPEEMVVPDIDIDSINGSVESFR